MVSLPSRLLTLALLAALAFSSLALQLFRWQVWEGPRLARQAVAQHSESLPLAAARGPIYDRYHRPLTGTETTWSLAVFPRLLPPSVRPRLTAALAQALGWPRERISARLTPATPHFLKRDLRPDEVATLRQLLSTQKGNFPGLVLAPETLRSPRALAAHVLGYVNLADNRGVSGLEASYNHILQHESATRLLAVVDANHRLIPGLGYRIQSHPLAAWGGSVSTTLEPRLQALVERELARTGLPGAVVLLEASTGEILALASSPTFNPNQIDPYLRAPHSPLLNRALRAYYPGSVFKMVIALAALNEGVVHLDEEFTDPGYIEVSGHRFHCWREGGHGRLTFAQAFAQSCNPVFIEVGRRLGGARILAYARALGLGQPVRVGLPGEERGSLPTLRGLSQADLANLSIGQKGVLTTPLQLARLLTAVLHEGRPLPLRLVRAVTGPGRSSGLSPMAPPSAPPLPPLPRPLRPGVLQELQALLAATTEYGTGKAASVPYFGSAGKTGSAQTGRRGPRGELQVDAWFVGYAPLFNPRYLAVVFLEGGESGGSRAAPLFRAIMEKALKL